MFTQVSPCLTLPNLAVHLAGLTGSASALFASIAEDEWRRPYAPGKWTRIEVLGHLLDSAAHNHQRIALALHSDVMSAPGYDGDSQVRVQHYAAAPVETLVEAWTAWNRVIAYVIAQIPGDKEQTPCTIGSYAAVTLGELALDYVAHLEHHLRQIAGDNALPFSGMPWPPAGRWQ